MNCELSLRNRQRTRRINLRLLRRITRRLLTEGPCSGPFALGLHLVDATEMARLNESYLSHPGSTDVITFDYSVHVGQASRLPRQPQSRARVSAQKRRPVPIPARRNVSPPLLYGEIFISLDDAVVQARKFRTTWHSELIRYLIHGILHLRGYDDRRPACRRQMKREENRLLREISLRFALSALERTPKLSV
jgi:probable rRNA maturation factor